jgi:hypothetical protein
MVDQVPVTYATSTIVRCGCGNVDRMLDPLAGWTCPICDREIPARGNVIARLGATVNKRCNWGKP